MRGVGGGGKPSVSLEWVVVIILRSKSKKSLKQYRRTIQKSTSVWVVFFCGGFHPLLHCKFLQRPFPRLRCLLILAERFFRLGNRDRFESRDCAVGRCHEGDGVRK